MAGSTHELAAENLARFGLVAVVSIGVLLLRLPARRLGLAQPLGRGHFALLVVRFALTVARHALRAEAAGGSVLVGELLQVNRELLGVALAKGV